MTWQFNRANIVLGIVALLGIAQFACSVVRAVNNYAGDYSITENFLSDLGCTQTMAGADNSASSLVFNRSIIGLGISLIPFFAAMPTVLETGRSLLRFSGVLSAVGLIGIGLTPYDLHFVEHHVALGLWIGPMILMVVAFFTVAKLEGAASVALSIGTSLVVLAACAYAFAGDHDGHVIFQKVVVILAVVWFCLVFVSVSVSTVRAISSRRQVVEEQARHYLKIIQRNHRRRYK